MSRYVASIRWFPDDPLTDHAEDVARRCDKCAHGFITSPDEMRVFGVRCDWLDGRYHFRADHYCANWAPSAAQS